MEIWVLPVVLGTIFLLAVLGIRYRHSLLDGLPAPHDINQYNAEPIPARYPPQVLNRLVLPDNIKGLVGIRQWTWTEGVLSSRNHKFTWTSNKITADKIPTADNQNGIYAYQLGSLTPTWLHHIGVVEMLGHIEVHADGVLRAEKCKILVIIVNWGLAQWGKDISSRYNIPIYISNYPEQAFKEWLLGADGIKWLNHNYKLLNPGKLKILEEAEKLLGADL